jgi:hypothetical protein
MNELGAMPSSPEMEEGKGKGEAPEMEEGKGKGEAKKMPTGKMPGGSGGGFYARKGHHRHQPPRPRECHWTKYLLGDGIHRAASMKEDRRKGDNPPIAAVSSPTARLPLAPIENRTHK